MALMALNGNPANAAQINESRDQQVYIPTPEEKQDIDLVFSLLEEGKQARGKYDKDWDKWERYYDGDQWEIKRAEGKSMPVINVIRSCVQTILPILTDAQPGFDITAKIPQDYQFADLLSNLIQYWWTYRGMNLTLVDTLTQSLFYHAGIEKVIWNEELENGLGDVEVVDIDPRDVWVPKDCKDFDKNCRWVIHRMCKPLGEIRRLFPDKADSITATGESKEKTDKQIKSYDGSVQVVSPLDKKEKSIPTGQSGGYDSRKVVEIYELWIDDTSLIDVEEEDKGSGQKKVVQKRRYPHGKIITVTENKVLLQAVENPRKDGKKPFVRFVDSTRPNRFYGDGEIGQLFEPQKMLNKVVACIFDNINMMGNGVWILDNNSGVDPEQLTNIVGQAIEKNPGSEVIRLAGSPLPAYIFNFYIEMQKIIDQISGVHDVTAGRKPSGVTAAEAIQTLQEAAQTRIRLKERNLQCSLIQLGYLITGTMMQYYTQSRVSKVTKKQGWPEFVEFYFKHPDELSYSYVKKTTTYNEEQKKWIAEQDWQESSPTHGIFDIEVVAGTALPYFKEKRGSLALQLFDRKAIDQEALLETLGWPKGDLIMKRMKEAESGQAPPQPGKPV